jgi:cytochrome c oxidase subunit III
LNDSHAVQGTPLAVEHEARPELRHHFADEQQQRNAASLGMWWFLGTEIMFFGGMFCGYLVYRRIYFPEFAAASRSLNLWIGTVNTAVLICSSLTVAQAVRAAQLGKRKLQVQLLLATIFFGLVFLGVKGYEWKEKYEEHHIPTFHFNAQDLVRDNPSLHLDPQRTKIFFSLYFALTGMHALHMVVGVGIFSVITFMAWKGKFTPEYHTPLEIAGLYWHFVDIVWIYLFPLLYLIDRRPGA